MPRRSTRVRQPAAGYLPSALVLDCSVTLAWYLDGEGTEFTDRLLHATPTLEIWVSALWVPEFSNALFAAERRRRITSVERVQIVGQAARHGFHVDSHMMTLPQTDELSASQGLTPYDAAYFELARRRKLPLATLDAALVKACRAAKLVLITDLSLFPLP